jgi:hypothetical protein
MNWLVTNAKRTHVSMQSKMKFHLQSARINACHDQLHHGLVHCLFLLLAPVLPLHCKILVDLSSTEHERGQA